MTGFHKSFSAGRQLTAREQRAAKWFPAPLPQNWMLEKSQQLDGLVRHGANMGRLRSSGNPEKVGEVEIGTIGGAGTCSRKAQNGPAKIERWGGNTRAQQETEEGKGEQKTLPYKAWFDASCQCWWQRSNEYHNVCSETCKYTTEKKTGTNLTLRYTSMKLNPEQLLWLLVQCWCLWSVTPAVGRVVLVPITTTSAGNRGSFKANMEKSLTHNFI